jgi:hypothetical protein
MKKFRQESKSFFNTYPKKDSLESKERVLEIFQKKIENLKAKVKYILVSYETGQEKHDSKDYEHFHVLVKFDRQVRIIDQNFWDLNSVHGHYKTLDKKKDSFESVRSYCQKDDDYLEYYDRKPRPDLGKVKSTTESSFLAYLIYEISKKEPKSQIDVKNHLKAALECLSLDSKAIYHLNEKKLLKGLLNAFKGDIVINIGTRYERCKFVNVPEGIVEWEKSEKHKKALILHGKSGTGKTSLAKSLFKNPLIVSDLEDLKKLNDNHDGIVFDDFSFRKLTKDKKIFILDLETSRTLPVKFGSITIDAGMPRVFTTNDNLEDFLGYMMVPKEFTRRLISFEIVDELFKD